MIYVRLMGLVVFLVGLSGHFAMANCVAHAERSWGKSRIIADSLGPDCAHAVLVLTVRDVRGNAIWTNVHRSSDLMTFQNIPKLNAKTIVSELVNWIALDSRMNTSANLPDWPQSEKDGSLPPGAEFPFRVSENLDRSAYLAVRKAGLPIFCFVSGMESQTCLVLDKGNVTEVGTQSFPG
ncbi:MAG: hypothetical protein ABIN69_05825 [Aestuariivirga sp.]